MLGRLAQSLGRSLWSSSGAAVGSSAVTRAQSVPSTSGRGLLDCLASHVPSCTPLQAASGSSSCPSLLSFIRTKYTYAFKRAAAVPGLIYWKPRTNGLRHRISIDYKALGIYTGDPVPQLSFRKNNTAGRNIHGHITVRGRGGGIHKMLRVVDTKQGMTSNSVLGSGVVERIELDPNRTGFLALVKYHTGEGKVEYRYHLAPHGLREGDTVTGGSDAPIQLGSRLKLRDIPLGVTIHNIEMRPGKGGQLARAAGVGATIMYKEEKFAVLTMPSGEVRRLPLDCAATIGNVSNPLNKLTIMGKAGINRLRGRRPKVRGVAMNPVDHPMGGKTSGGRPSCTPWGVYCKGQRTRLRNKWTNKYIITRVKGQPIDKFSQVKKNVAKKALQKRLNSGAAPPRKNPGPPAELLGPVAPAWGVVMSGQQAKKVAHA